MKLDNRNQSITIKEAIKQIVYQLRFCKQKATNSTKSKWICGTNCISTVRDITQVHSFICVRQWKIRVEASKVITISLKTLDFVTPMLFGTFS